MVARWRLTIPQQFVYQELAVQWRAMAKQTEALEAATCCEAR